MASKKKKKAQNTERTFALVCVGIMLFSVVASILVYFI